MVSFGWSASCLVEAIKLANRVRKALKDAGGAASEYQDAVLFLNALEITFNNIKDYIANNPSDSADSIKAHFLTIEKPWKTFEETLASYEKSLAEHSARSKLKQVPDKIKFALKKAEAVRKLKDDISKTVQAINISLTLSLVDAIKKQVEGAIPKNLAQEISNLQKADERHEASNSQQLTRLKHVQQTLSNVEQVVKSASDSPSTKDQIQRMSDSLLQQIKEIMESEKGTLFKEQEVALHEVKDEIAMDIEKQISSIRDAVDAKPTTHAFSWSILTFTFGVLLSSYATRASRPKNPYETVSLNSPVPRPRGLPTQDFLSINEAKSMEGLPHNSAPKEASSNGSTKRSREMSDTGSRGSKTKLYQCPYGHTTPFNSVRELGSHLLSAYLKTDYPRACPIKDCLMNYRNKDLMTTHIRRHGHRVPDRKDGDRLTPDIDAIDEKLLKPCPPSSSYSRGGDSIPHFVDDTWFCQNCGAANLLALASERCPVCGASKL